MSIEIMDEHEQSELVRNWLRKNIGAIVGGIALGVLAIVGWHQWQNYQQSYREKAETRYFDLVASLEKKDVQSFDKMAGSIKQDYGNTTYAVLTALRTANAAVAKGDGKAALASLQWAETHADLDELKELISLRIVALKLDDGQAQAALDELKKIGSGGYKALVAELKGDAMLVLKKNDEAAKAYREALANLDSASFARRTAIEMKLYDIVEQPVAAPAKAGG